MVKQPQTEASAFTMSSEDFPALPGTAPPIASANDSSGKATPSTVNKIEDSNDRTVATTDKNMKRGIITSPEGSNDKILLVIVNIICSLIQFL